MFAATLSIISLFKKLVKHFLFFIFLNYFYVLSFFHVFFVFLLIFILPTKKGIRSLGFPLSYFIFHCTLKTAHKLFISNLLPFPTLTFWSSPRPISSSQLHALQHFHPCPINLVVFKGSYSYDGISHLEGGFTLRCLQRLSRPDLATRPCTWQCNRYTRGQSIPVLSY